MLAVGLLAALALAGLADRWQGNWVVRDADYPGSVQAWSVRDGDVLVYDARRRDTRREQFEVVSPCRVARTLVMQDGTRRTTFDTFVFARDGLHVAPSPAPGGVRWGPHVLACVGNDVYRFEAGEPVCSRFDTGSDGLRSTARAECSLVETPAGSSFVLRPLGGGESVRLDVYGDALLSQPLLGLVAERRASFADAVLRADALR